MRYIRSTLALLAALVASANASHNTEELHVSAAPPTATAASLQFHGKLPVHSSENDAWHYRWHRGGAFLFHEEIHPCHLPNHKKQRKCSISNATTMRKNLLHVNTTIVNHMGFVTLQYDLGKKGVRDGDFIGVYCVDQEETPSQIVDPADFIDYSMVNISTGVSSSSQHTLVVGPLVNMRCSYQFRYLRKITALTYHSISESAHVEMERGHSEPVQVHLSLTETPGEMRVTWTSGKGAHQHVHYGSHAGNMTSHAEASTTSYAASDLCSEPATREAAQWFRHPGYIHHGVMTGLRSGHTYYYNVGSKFGLISRQLSFTYPPLPGVLSNDGSSPSASLSSSPSKPHSQSFFVFGDLGQGVLEALPVGSVGSGSGSAAGGSERHYSALGFESRPSFTSPKTVMNRIACDLDHDHSHKYNALVHVGDLAYAKGRAFLWDQFGALIERVASRIPYMVAIGNHEYDYSSNGTAHDLSGSQAASTNGWHPAQGNYGNDSHGECGVPAVKRFQMPQNGNNLFWYSFTIGLSHHIVLSSEHDCTPTSPMYKWLVEELTGKVNRTETPWVLVHLHRPLYASEKYPSDYNVSLLLRKHLEPVLMAHHVDVVFSGHYHAYERTCAVFKEKCYDHEDKEEARAPIHIMVGSGGAELDDIDYYTTNSSSSQGSGDGDSMPWSASRLQEYGYGRFHVLNASHAHFEFVRARDHKVADEVWIVSHHQWPTAGGGV